MRLLKQSTGRNVMVFMTDSADHVAGKTGLTLTITLSKNGGAFGSVAPTVTERGDGWYSVALASGDTDTLGDLVLHVAAAGADPTDLVCQVVGGSLDADVSSRLADADYSAPPTAADVRAEIDANSSKLDVAVSTRLAAAGYTAPDNAGIAAAAADADAAATAAAAIKTKTDQLAFTVAGQVDANAKSMNDAEILGTGASSDKWRGA